MIIYDDIFKWDGWGGRLKLCSGQCRLRILDLRKGESDAATPLKPYLVVACETDPPKGGRDRVAIRSMAGHIATQVCQRWQIDPARMQYVEYYPASAYGSRKEHLIPARYEIADFQWGPKGALNPRWRPLGPELINVLSAIIER